MTDGGSLLTLTYYGAERVMPHYNVMGVAKAALEASVRYLAADLGRPDIRVNAISAGPIKTLAAVRHRRLPLHPEVERAQRAAAPQRHGSRSAGSALYLLSDLSTGVTGEIHHVDCGYHVVGMIASTPRADPRDARRTRAQPAGCRATASAGSSGSPPGARATGPRSAASSTASRPACRWRRPTSRSGSTTPAGQSRFTTQRREPDPVQDPVRRLRGRDHRHADRAAHRQRRPALAGLLARSRTSSAPATPTTPTRPSTASATTAAAAGPVGARDGDAGGGRRHRPQGARVTACASAAPWSRSARTRSTAPLGLGRRSTAIPSGAPTGRPPRRGPASSTRCARPAPRRRGDRGGRLRRAVGPGRSGLRQARRRPRQGADEHQRGEGRRDRRRLRRRAMSGEENADEMRMNGRHGAVSCPTTPAASWAASRPAGHRRPVAVKPTSSILAAAAVTAAGEEAEISHQGPARSPASASAACRWARR